MNEGITSWKRVVKLIWANPNLIGVSKQTLLYASYRSICHHPSLLFHVCIDTRLSGKRDHLRDKHELICGPASSFLPASPSWEAIHPGHISFSAFGRGGGAGDMHMPSLHCPRCCPLRLSSWRFNAAPHSWMGSLSD